MAILLTDQLSTEADSDNDTDTDTDTDTYTNIIIDFALALPIAVTIPMLDCDSKLQRKGKIHFGNEIAFDLSMYCIHACNRLKKNVEISELVS